MTLAAESKTMLPLAARMRPSCLAEFVGQSHLLGDGKALRHAIDTGLLHSMIFWGPPGTGKTTLARLMAQKFDARFVALSAVLSGVKEVRHAVQEAEMAQQQGHATLLFIDEIHRFNKAQQDAFLPYVEAGTVTLIGATTENPSFALNNALLSRARVYVFQSLAIEELQQLLAQALSDPLRGLGAKPLVLTALQEDSLCRAADGDGRRLLNLLEMLADFAEPDHEKGIDKIPDNALNEVLTGLVRRFDKQGDDFYDLISALHKSVRGSDPDAALYWFSRMIDGGCDPLYLARRIVRMATEDIGNADPRALTLALEAYQVQERLGSPEGELALAQAVIYLACCAKSNACYVAYGQAMADAKSYGSLPVPLHIRNAPTKLMKNLGFGKAYRYAHDEPNAYAAGETYFPPELVNKQYYFPVDRGLEIKIKQKLTTLKKINDTQKIREE